MTWRASRACPWRPSGGGGFFKGGPKYLKIGAAVRYKPEDISAWLESRPYGGGQQAEAR